jgi:hypothetical protein
MTIKNIFKFWSIIFLLSGCTSFAEKREQYAVDFLANEVINKVPGYENIQVYFDGKLSKCNIENHYWEKEGQIPDFPNQISNILCDSLTNADSLVIPKSFIDLKKREFSKVSDTNSYFMEVSSAVRIEGFDNVLLKLKRNNGDELGVIIGYKPNGEFSKYRVMYYSSKIKH